MLHGEADSVVPLEGAVALHARLKQARLHIVANCSHQLHQEQPGEVMQIVSAFFSSAFAGQLGPGS
jgi:pimeloyl-ACP methyl ester carboxylesterase